MRSGDVSRTMTRTELETRLDDVIRRGGADGLNALRDEARGIAPLIDRNTGYAALDRLICALLGTRDDNLAKQAGQGPRCGDAIRSRTAQAVRGIAWRAARYRALFAAYRGPHGNLS